MNGLQIPFTGLKKQYNNLRQAVLDTTDEVLRSGQLMNGNYTAEFENWLESGWCETTLVVAVLIM